MGYGAAGNLSGLASAFGSDRASAILGTGANRGNVRSAGLSAITDANTQVGQAQSGGILGAAKARAAGANNILGLVTGGISKLLTGGFGGGGGVPSSVGVY
jgi:hypothetical protein